MNTLYNVADSGYIGFHVIFPDSKKSVFESVCPVRLAQICDLSYYLPSTTLSNEELLREFEGSTREKVLKKIGIEERPIAAPGETALDMGVAAGQKLFEQERCSREEIDFLLFCTQSPDYFLPTSACVIQDRLGLPKTCGALDFNLGCSGYVYGLALCKGLVETGICNNALLITSETYSKYINKQDRTNRPLFGDGASATLIRAVESDSSEPLIGPFVFGTDGGGANLLIVPAGAHRLPYSTETAIEKFDTQGNLRSQNQLYMHGSKIFNFVLQNIPLLVNELLRVGGKTKEQVDCFIFHQANHFMLERLRQQCDIDPSRYFNNIRTRGNTVSSSIPIAMIDAQNEGMLRSGHSAMLVGFGVGLSWGAALVRLP